MVALPWLFAVALPTPGPSELESQPPKEKDSDQRVDRELSLLFGESLIGPWPELASSVEPTGQVRRHGAQGWLLAALALTAVVGVGSYALVKSGTESRSIEERDTYSQRLQMSIEDGHIDYAAELADRLQGERSSLDPDDPHFEQLLRAEASVYRYFDAKAERFELVWPHLRDGASSAPSATRRVAYLTVLSREERAQHLAELERLQVEFPRDPEIHYLVASSLAQKGKVDAARGAYRQSEGFGPAWSSHRFDQLQFERQHEGAEAAAKIAAGMLQIDPNSAWSRFAAKLTKTPVGPEASDTGAPTSSPVADHHIKLAQAVQANASGNASRAAELIDAAVVAVHGEPPFMIDAVDYLVGHDSSALAQRITSAAEWPKDSPVAIAKRQQLSKASPEQ